MATKKIQILDSIVKTYTAGTGLTLSGTQFKHSNSVTANTSGINSSKTLSFGNSTALKSVKYDAQGHVTGTNSFNLTMPSIAAKMSPDATSAIPVFSTGVGNPHLVLTDGNSVLSDIQFVGSGIVSIGTGSNDVINISASLPFAYTSSSCTINISQSGSNSVNTDISCTCYKFGSIVYIISNDTISQTFNITENCTINISGLPYSSSSSCYSFGGFVQTGPYSCIPYYFALVGTNGTIVFDKANLSNYSGNSTIQLGGRLSFIYYT